MRMLLLLLLPAMLLAAPQDAADYASRRARAGQLVNNAQGVEALPLLEALAKENPQDNIVAQELSLALYMKGRSVTDPGEAATLFSRARDEALRAKRLGSRSEWLDQMVATVNQGTAGATPASENPEAAAAMREGETAFAKGDNAAARAAYQRALNVDPKLYSAALFMGDSYFRENDAEHAGEWFQKAIQIDPNKDAAYRYWGDALMRAGRSDDAKARFIDAVVAQPYTNPPWIELRKWAKLNHFVVAPARIERPVVSADAHEITVDPKSVTEDGTGRSAWLAYSISRGAWRLKVADTQPYRHSLEEETQALEAVLESLREKHVEPARLDSGLSALRELASRGMLQPWILLNGADNGIAQDYPAWRETHRDLLRKYVEQDVLRAQ